MAKHLFTILLIVMKINSVICGDALKTVQTFPDNSIDCVITSPPYYQLRNYGFNNQWGLETTYIEFLDKMIFLTAELKRVVKDGGTLWINFGDSYNGSGNDSGKQNQKFSQHLKKIKVGEASPTKCNFNYGYPRKCQFLIPHRYAIRCIDELGLILRNDIVWAKRNGMPESVRDRFSKKHEYFFLFVKKQKYYFDLDSIRDTHKTKDKRVQGIIRSRILGYHNKLYQSYKTKIPVDQAELFGSPRARYSRESLSEKRKFYRENNLPEGNPKGKNPGDVADFWDIPTKPSTVKHFASYNFDLIDKPIIAGCPEGGIILDPFCGSGTTLVRAKQLDRNYIGIDGKKEYCKMAEERLK